MENFLEKIRNLPQNQKKLILWSVTAILAIILLFFFVKKTQKNFREFDMGDFSRDPIQEIKKELDSMPKMEIPEENPTSTEFNENTEN